MTNFDRNTRTLIVSFVIAIFALIPLRFIEVGTQQSLIEESQVLGETINEEPIEEVKIETPYDLIESCTSIEEVKMVEDEVVIKLENEDLSESQISEILDELKRVESNICR